MSVITLFRTNCTRETSAGSVGIDCVVSLLVDLSEGKVIDETTMLNLTRSIYQFILC